MRGPSRPGKAQPPPGKITMQQGCLEGNQYFPGGAALAGSARCWPGRGPCRPGQAQPPPGTKSALCLLSSPGGAALTGPTRYEPVRGNCRPGKAQPPPGKITAQPEMSCSHCAWQGYNFYVNSGQIALPVNFLRYVSYGAGSAQGAASRRRPLYPRAPASKIATAWSLRLIPAGFGSGRGSVHAKHGPQPASMRAAPAFRERLSDFEAVSTGSFSNNGE